MERQHPPSDARIHLERIGYVSSDEHDHRRVDWSRVRSRVVLDAALAPALRGLEGYSHVIVVAWLHLIPEELRTRLEAYPAGDEQLPVQGALALRGGARPNPLGVTVCRLHRVEGSTLEVEGLDLVDGTPVLDVKPYVPFYDSVPRATIPRWAGG
jgi:tRNA (adenine37-N6)-methyltransferase